MNYNALSKYRTELMGVAILWVMLFHAHDLDLGHHTLNWIRSVGFGGVDIFIFLSSMGLVAALSKREQSYSEFMARRAQRILPSYYLVMVPYTVFLIRALSRGVWSALVWNIFLLYYWVQPEGAFNWYVAGAMSFYAITPICVRCLRRSKHREALTVIGVFFGLFLGRVLMTDGYWFYMDVFYRVPIFCIGLLIGFYVLEKRKLRRKDTLFWSGWLGLGVVYFLCLGKGAYADYRPLCYLFLFTTVPMCFVVCWFFEHLSLWGACDCFFRLLGRYSLEIYLLNVSLFSEVDLLRKFIHFGPSNRLYYLLTFSANIILAIPLHNAAKKLLYLVRSWTENKRGEASF